VFEPAQLDNLLKVGLIGHWMGGRSGLGTRDLSGYGNHGAFIGAPKWTMSNASQRDAIQTAAGTDQIRCGTAAIATDLTTLSISAWVLTTSTTNEQQIVTKLTATASAGWVFVIDAGGALSWFASTSATANALSTTQTLVTGAWYHVGYTQVAMLAGNNSILYINGAPQALASQSSPNGVYASDATANLAFAGRDLDTLGLVGIIDDVRIWNRTLSQAEMARLANVQTPIVTAMGHRHTASLSSDPPWTSYPPMNRWSAINIGY
jgi:hypothetical protein